MRLAKILIFSLTLLLIAGCASGPVKLNPPERQTVYEGFKRTQKQLEYWQMHARFSFRVDKRVHSGTIRWVNNAKSYAIKFTGPMDQGAVILTSDGKTVTLTDSQGFEGSATTPEAMLSRYTEYELPVSNLKYWVIGLPTPYSTPQITLNPQGYPIAMQQDNWHIEYQYYRDVGDYLLPRKIIITHPTLSIKLSIYNWQVSDKSFVK